MLLNWTQLLMQSSTALGPPRQLLSDNGTVFRSKEMAELLLHWQVEAVFACAYRSRGNGVVERVHRTIKRMVARS